MPLDAFSNSICNVGHLEFKPECVRWSSADGECEREPTIGRVALCEEDISDSVYVGNLDGYRM